MTIIDELRCSSVKLNYLTVDHRRIFGSFLIEKELPRSCFSTRFDFLLYYISSSITSSRINGEFWCSFLSKQHDFAIDHDHRQEGRSVEGTKSNHCELICRLLLFCFCLVNHCFVNPIWTRLFLIFYVPRGRKFKNIKVMIMKLRGRIILPNMYPLT